MMGSSPGRPPTPPIRRAVGGVVAPLAVAVLGVATLAAAIGLALSAAGGPSSPPAVAATLGRLPATLGRLPATSGRLPAPRSPQPAARRPPPAIVAGPGAELVTSTVLATVRATAPRYASPGSAPSGTVAASWYGRPSVLPVIVRRPGWVEVRLQQRPNESTAWLPLADVTLGLTTDEIVVDLARTRLSLFHAGRLVFSAPAGVGSPDDPTPAGQYFVAFDEHPPQPNPGYGPFIIVTSAHSPAISDWEGSGDAVIGIHGPLGEDSLIGSSGARISHGCIRLHDAALEELAAVPAGTPIDIIG